jgi:hypothetical protein
MKLKRIATIGVMAALLASPALAQDTCTLVGELAAETAVNRDRGISESAELRHIDSSITGKSASDRHDRRYFKGLVAFVYGEGASLVPAQIQAVATSNCYRQDDSEQ